jgi:hypothetical protein
VSFTVTGAQNLAYAGAFFSGIKNALDSGSLSYRNLSDPGASIPGYTHGAEISTIEQEISSAGDYTLPSDSAGGAIYTFVHVAGTTTIAGSGIGDNVLVASGDSTASATYIDSGGNNIINFVDGNDIYRGDLSSSGADTVLAGSGNDLISTGGGRGLVGSGSGSADITLQDTVAAGATSNAKSINPDDYNQFVDLNEGADTVALNGVADVAVAAMAGQSITSGNTGVDLVALMPQAGGGAGGDDTVTGSGGATLSVYDATDGNSISGGSGPLVVVFADSVSGNVTAGTGTNVVYGASADTITLVSQDTAASFVFVAGTGAGESVDGASSSGLVMVLGTGNETLVGGTATTFNTNYDAATGLTGTVTIDDFSGKDIFNFVGYTAAQYQAALKSATVSGGNTEITLSDNTKVNFIGVTSLTGHTTNS